MARDRRISEFGQLLRSRSALFVLFGFLCSSFVLTFYDGYRSIYLDATLLEGRFPDRPMAQNVEEARQRSYDLFMEEIAFFQERSSMGNPQQTLDKRHKLRWLYKSVEAAAYRFIAAHLSIPAALYAKYIHYTGWTFIALIAIAATARRLRGRLAAEGLAIISLALFAYLALVSTVPRMVDQHSLIEMGVVAAGLYFALSRRLGWFCFAVAIAAANRETGAALGVIYAIINWRERLFWAPLVMGPVFLAIINFDLFLLPDFYSPSNFVVHGEAGYINLFNLRSLSPSLIGFTALKTFVVLAPAFWLVPRIWNVALGRRLFIVGSFYLFVLLFGTILGNLFPYAMLLPVMFAMAALSYPVVSAEVCNP